LGQYIIRNIFQSLHEAQAHRPNLEFKIEWVPGHMDIEGNEKADEEAKMAAQERPQRQQTPLQYKLKSAQVTKINKDINKVARETWNHIKINARQQRKLTRP